MDLASADVEPLFRKNLVKGSYWYEAPEGRFIKGAQAWDIRNQVIHTKRSIWIGDMRTEPKKTICVKF